MTADMMEHQVEYGTRWRVVAWALAPCLAALVALGSVIATGALALSFQTQSGTLGLATRGLEGEGFGIAVVTVPIRNSDGSAGTTEAARIGLADGRINGLCIAHPVDLAGRAFTLLIRGGDSSSSTYEIAAGGLLLDLAEAEGVISARGNLAVNKNAADVRLGNSRLSLGGAPDRFGLQADSARLVNIVATVRSISIPNLLKVPNFSVRVVAGTQACPAPNA